MSGSLIISLRLTHLWIESKSDGNKIKLVTIATNKVIEISSPNAAVPPKSEAAKILNPHQNRKQQKY